MTTNPVVFACPLDCFDGCSLVASVKNGKVVDIRGNPHHPLTRGLVCPKGKKHLKRLYHPDRLLTPRYKQNGKWKNISWELAIELIAEKLETVRCRYGSSAVLNYSDSGYGGLLKSVDHIFFNYFGGVSVPVGSLCWAAGIAAQQYDFGDVRSHSPEDLSRAKALFIWGRNPKATNIHLLDAIQKARAGGATIIVIDPVETATAKMADQYIRIKPGTDGALALGMAHIIARDKLYDHRFVRNHVLGFQRFEQTIKQYTPAIVENITKIPSATINSMANRYANTQPASIIIGYGLQRYRNGGNTVRCIDALGALCGNIGRSGGGINYANKTTAPFFDNGEKKSLPFAKHRRTFPLPRLAEFVLAENSPAIKFMFISKANPLVQIGNIHKTIRAFQRIDFKVVVDMFMTDTARHADLVLPCTSVLEEEDVIFNSMFSPYVNYSAQAVEPRNNIVSEYDLFRRIANHLKLENYPQIDRHTFLKTSISPLLNELNTSWDVFSRTSFLRLPTPDVPWHNLRFSTPSGKYELYSEKALQDGLNPLPFYDEPASENELFPLRLITPHTSGSLHSQHFTDICDVPDIHLNRITMTQFSIQTGQQVRVVTKYGSLIGIACSDETVANHLVMIYQGWWHRSGSVNLLTGDQMTDMGNNAAYFDCFCRLEVIP